jgi:hypothetical protein
MDFKVVDVPTGGAQPTSPLVDALLANVGKALSISCGEREPNNVRKTLRMSLNNRGLLKTYHFKTRIELGTNALVAWLEKKEETNGETR